MAAEVKTMLEAWLKITSWNQADDLVSPTRQQAKQSMRRPSCNGSSGAVGQADVGEFRYGVKREGKVWPEWPKITFHDLRHRFATSCAMAGVPIPTLKEWLGHRDI